MLISYRQNTWLSGFVNASFAAHKKKPQPNTIFPKTKTKLFISCFHQPIFQLYRMQLKIHGRSVEELPYFSIF